MGQTEAATTLKLAQSSMNQDVKMSQVSTLNIQVKRHPGQNLLSRHTDTQPRHSWTTQVVSNETGFKELKATSRIRITSSKTNKEDVQGALSVHHHSHHHCHNCQKLLTSEVLQDAFSSFVFSSTTTEPLMFLEQSYVKTTTTKYRHRCRYHQWPTYSTQVIMIALWNRADHYIFMLWFLSSSIFPVPNLSGRTLDVYHTSTHGVALVRI